MKPVHYVLHFEPNLETFRFQGKTHITVEVEKPTNEIRLDAKELTIQSCEIKSSKGIVSCSFTLNADREEMLITLSEPVEGEIQVHIVYEGIHNDNLYGFYRSRMTYEGQVSYMVTTQFEERDARAAFPGFDEPALKATFDIEYLIPADLKGIANTAILEEKLVDSGKKLVRFQRTPKMSTYLLYFGIGNFEILEDTSKAPTLRMVTAPGKSQYGKFALDIARKSFDYGEKFFQAPYPISKCDFIVVEDFAAGAMENYGAITFREHMLLMYPGKTSKPQMVSIANVVAHEIAHMWFGDLVSPALWKYVWLNESFATYFTAAIPYHYFPEWRSWEELMGGRGLAGFRRDSLVSTVPIELPGEQEVTIDASSAPIIYAKGALIMRIIAGYLGEDLFFKGIRHYLKKYAYEAATSEDCWLAFEEASQKPIIALANSWVMQPGYPYITVNQQGDKVHLSQARFTLLENSSETQWIIPIKVQVFKTDGTEEILDMMMEDRTMEFTLPTGTETFKLNMDQSGFYRVKYSVEHFDQLGKFAQQERLSAMDRFGLQNDFANFMQRGDYSVTEYVKFIQSYYADEKSPLCLSDIASTLSQIDYIMDSARDQIREAGRIIAEHALDRMGYLPRDGEIAMDAENRTMLLWIGGHFGSAKIRAFADEYFQKLQKGEDIPADIFRSVVRLGAELHPETWDFMISQIKDPNVPEALKQHWINALGSFTEKDLLEKSLEANLTVIPKLNRAIILVRVASNLVSQGWFWDYYTSNFERLSQELPKSSLGNTLATVPQFCAIYAKDEVLSFLKQIGEKMPPAKAIVEMAAEISEVYARSHARSP